jgi:F-type H+-transporting ATPase subunit gamma
MANIKDLKTKIKSTKGTLKITTAMKLVSAAKLNRAQQAIQSSRPYALELEGTIKTISALVKGYSHKYLESSDNKQVAVLVVSSDKGLCGGYNSQLAKCIRNFCSENDSELDIKLHFFGRKVEELLKKDGLNMGKQYNPDKNVPDYSSVEAVANELADLFSNGEFGRVYVAYNVFESAMSFVPTVKQLLPFSLSEEEKDEFNNEFPFDFKYEPSPSEILDSLIPNTFVSSLYTSFLDAQAAEHGSRMTAMESASGNCKDAIKTLTLKMNKLRQAAITKELIEVVSGAESLNG